MTDSGFVPLCTPDDRRCQGEVAIEVCAPTGLEWLVESCGENASCCEPPDCPDIRCVGPCDALAELPSSAGCAFTANRNLHELPEWPDGIVLGNPNSEGVAHVELFYVPEGTRDEVPYEAVPELWLAPGEVTAEGIELRTPLLPAGDSILRTGGIFRIYSDLPIIASQHSPLQANVSNESSLLLPDGSLGQTYVVTAYAAAGFRPSYFTVIALEDETLVEWTPKVWATGGNGVPIPPVAIGETSSMRLNRYETLQIVPSDNGVPDDPIQQETVRDVSGTVVQASKKVWVLGGANKARIPILDGGTGDTLQEVLFPVEHWGTAYVVPSPPSRYEPTPEEPPLVERYYLRLFAGQDDVTIVSVGNEPGFPVSLPKRGDFVELEFPVGLHLQLSANRKFLPVQYQRSRILNSELPQSELDFPATITRGDPAMVQLVPVDQFLERYTFATGVGFAFNYVQVTRRAAGAEVRLRPTAGAGVERIVEGYAPVGGYEVATVAIEQGGYEIVSEDPFGIIQSGSTRSVPGEDPGCAQNDGGPDGSVQECNATYAYPGGMKAKEIVVP